jgi:mannose-6-phosphate isomerase-like protein (cupin superfamily)
MKQMKITRVVDTSAFQNVHVVEAKRIYDTENAEVIHMSLTPGQSLKKHTTPVDVFFYILEGKGVVEIGDEKQEVEKDMLIDSPKGTPHLLSNTGDGTFRFLVVKIPKQKEPKKVHS